MLNPIRDRILFPLTLALIVIACLSNTTPASAAGPFDNTGVTLTGVSYGAGAWGDYDNDGDLDLILTGWTGTGAIATLYRYNHLAGDFTAIEIGLKGVFDSAVAWGDYDQDGDLDLLLAGETGTGLKTTVYRNDGPATDSVSTGSAWCFTEVQTGLPGVSHSAAAWGDVDQDGDLDILLTGHNGQAALAKIYHNTGGIFQDSQVDLPGVSHSASAWADYDGDGDLDILLTGYDGEKAITRLYRNDGPTGFIDLKTRLPGITAGNVAWADYDQDSDLDLLLAGRGHLAPISRVYRNDGELGFTDLKADLTGLENGAVTWLDYNADGHLDLLLTGNNGREPRTILYQNDRAGHFEPVDSGLPAVEFSAIAWRAIDQNNLLLLLAGQVNAEPLAGIYQANPAPAFTETITLIDPEKRDYVPTLTWGDYDADGDLDLLVTGAYYSMGLEFYRNDGPDAAGGPLTPVAGVIPKLNGGRIDWGDYDADGDLDMAVVNEEISSHARVAKIYRNDGGEQFTDIGANLANLGGAIKWGDYDVDGDLDILMLGGTRLEIYQNNAGEFSKAETNLTGLAQAIIACGDYDNDGDVDILLAGRNELFERVTILYRNDRLAPGSGLTFTPIEAGLTGVEFGAAAWGDYDADGDLDLVLTGAGQAGLVAQVYRNDGPAAGSGWTFTNIQADLTGVYYSTAAWGDYDADGRLDLIISGTAGSIPITRVYHNEGRDIFTELDLNLLGVRNGSTAWGDYDGDGRLDLVITGLETAKVYRNMIPPAPSWAFKEVDTGLPSYQDKRIDWADYDNDGDLDIVFAGKVYQNNTGNFTKLDVTLDSYSLSLLWADDDADGDMDIIQTNRLYLNQGDSTFEAQEVSLPIMSTGTATWADYDGDGDLDVLLMGEGKAGRLAKLYRNDGGGDFVDNGLLLPSLYRSAAGWGDYDGDGDLDLLVTGCASNMPCNSPVTKLYRNDGAWGPNWRFTELETDLIAVYAGAVTWEDYDRDGKADLLLTGCPDPLCTHPVSKLYRYSQAGHFVEVKAGLTGVYRGAAAWGDYDGDDDLDLLLTGDTRQGPVSQLYRNDGHGVFTGVQTGLTGVSDSAVLWGDYDGDGDLDILLQGHTPAGGITQLYRNDGQGQ